MLHSQVRLKQQILQSAGELQIYIFLILATIADKTNSLKANTTPKIVPNIRKPKKKTTVLINPNCKIL